MSGSIEFYHVLGIVCMEAAIVCTIVGIVLFFRFHIPRTISYLTGSRRKRGIQTMMQTAFVPPKAPYMPKPQQGVAVSQIVGKTEEIGIFQEDMVSPVKEKEDTSMDVEFQWGEELIAGARDVTQVEERKEEVWYFEQGEWKSKFVEVAEESRSTSREIDKEATTNLHMPYFDDGSERTTKLNMDEMYDGSERTTKLDMEGSYDGSEGTTKLDIEESFDGSERTTKLELETGYDGGEQTTKLDIEDLSNGAEKTTKLNVEVFENGYERTTRLDMESFKNDSENTGKLDVDIA